MAFPSVESEYSSGMTALRCDDVWMRDCQLCKQSLEGGVDSPPQLVPAINLPGRFGDPYPISMGDGRSVNRYFTLLCAPIMMRALTVLAVKQNIN